MPVSISGAGSISGLDQGFNVTSGSVGVGTTNPRTDLQVGAFGGGDSNIQLATGTSGASNILFGDGSAGSDYYKGFIKYNHSTDNLELYTTDDLIHYTGGSERLRIASDGVITGRGELRLTEGTSSVSNGDEIGSLMFTYPSNDNKNAKIVALQNAGTSGADLAFFTRTHGDATNTDGGTEKLRITSAGYVGINETSPDTYLHVKTGTDSALAKLEQTATNGRVQVQYLSPHGDWLQGIVGGTNTGDYLIYTGQSKNLTFYTSGALRQKIQSDGKVIIGGNANQTANRDLSVVAASGNSNEAQIGLQPTNSSGNYNPEVFISALSDGTYGAHMYFKTRDTSGNRLERLRITSDGKIGINQGSPSEKLEVYAGDILLSGNANGVSGGVGPDSALKFEYNGHQYAKIVGNGRDSSGYGDIDFYTSTSAGVSNLTQRMTIRADGNIGIGIANPTNKLHVQSSSDTGEIRLGGGNGAGEHRLFFQAHPSTAYIDSYGNNTHNPLSINADPLILNNSGSGKVLIKTTTSNDNKAHLLIDGTTACGNIITGRIHDSTNNNNSTVLLHRMNQGQGSQFSGDIMVNSWTGNAKVNCHITVRYNDQAVEVDVVNATHSAQITKANLRVVTADYGSNRYLGIQKNGGGTGVFYINALVSSNIDSTGNGGIREVANTSLGSVTTHGNLN
jgi:hypothetical protein